MSNKNIFLAVIVVAALAIGSFFYFGRSESPANPENAVEETGSVKNTSPTGAKTTTKTTTVSSKSASAPAPAKSQYPEIDFINSRTSFDLAGYDKVKMTVEKVAFGRGDAVTSTGCSGIPNANFSTYLYAGSGICISADKVDGSPRGILAVHALIENNGNIGFGGNSGTLKLHYLRADSTGTPRHRFANPLMDLASYYIQPYSSREVVLSYLVPEDQLAYNLLLDYTGALPEDPALQNAYSRSSGGLFINFSNHSLSIIKK